MATLIFDVTKKGGAQAPTWRDAEVVQLVECLGTALLPDWRDHLTESGALPLAHALDDWTRTLGRATPQPEREIARARLLYAVGAIRRRERAYRATLTKEAT